MADRKEEMLVAQLRCDIASGRLPAGSALPSRKLAKDYGVSRNTVKQALAALRGEGLVAAEEREAWRVTDFVRDGIVSALQTKFWLAWQTPRAGKMVQELLRLRKPLVTRAMAQLVMSKQEHPFPLTTHLGGLQAAELNGYPSLLEVLRAEEWAWEQVMKSHLGEVDLAIAQFVRRCLDPLTRSGLEVCAAPHSHDDWLDLEAAVLDQQYARAMRLTDRLLTDREPTWQLLATTPQHEAATAQ